MGAGDTLDTRQAQLIDNERLMAAFEADRIKRFRLIIERLKRERRSSVFQPGDIRHYRKAA